MEGHGFSNLQFATDLKKNLYLHNQNYLEIISIFFCIKCEIALFSFYKPKNWYKVKNKLRTS